MFSYLKKVLVAQLGYPKSIELLPMKPDCLRGFVIDPKTGRLLDLRKDFSIRSASFGWTKV
jgi:hypothetical protein